MNNSTLVVGDEESFLDYEEKVVYHLQKVLRTKDGMVHFAIMDLCAKLEDLIYYESLKQCNLSSGMNVWSKPESIRYYQDRCDLVLRNMETKSMNWKKIFEDNSHNPKLILQMLADENQRNRGITTNTTQSISNSSSSNIRNKTKYIDTSLLNATKSKKKTHTQVLQNHQVTNTTDSNTNIYTYNEDITYQNNNSNKSIDAKYDATTTNTTMEDDNNNTIDPLLTEHSFDDFGFDFTNDDEYALL